MLIQLSATLFTLLASSPSGLDHQDGSRAIEATGAVADGMSEEVDRLITAQVAFTCALSAIPMIGNLASIKDGEQPHSGWLAAGYVVGVVNVVGAGFANALAPEDYRLSAPLAVAGVFNLGLAVAGTLMDEPRAVGTSLSVAPVVLTDRGQATGVGLAISRGW